MVAAGPRHRRAAARCCSSVLVAVTNRGTNIPAPLFDAAAGRPRNLGPISVNLSRAGHAGGDHRLGAGQPRAAAPRRGDPGGDRRCGPTTWWKIAGRSWSCPPSLRCWLRAWASTWTMTRRLKGFNFQGGIQVAHTFTALLIALSLYTGAFIAEIVRAGILAIIARPDRGRLRAGPAPGPHDEPDHPAAGAAGDHPAADQPVPEPDQEHLAGHRGQLP